MPVTGYRSIMSRTDPRITGGVTQTGGERTLNAPAPVDPMPVNRKQPVAGGPTGISAPLPAGAAGPGGVSGARGPAARGSRSASGMPKRGAGASIGYLTRKNTTAPWLRGAQPTGSVIGG